MASNGDQHPPLPRIEIAQAAASPASENAALHPDGPSPWADDVPWGR